MIHPQAGEIKSVSLLTQFQLIDIFVFWSIRHFFFPLPFYYVTLIRSMSARNKIHVFLVSANSDILYTPKHLIKIAVIFLSDSFSKVS